MLALRCTAYLIVHPQSANDQIMPVIKVAARLEDWA